MKPFARINLSSAALHRGILVSSLALGELHGRHATCLADVDVSTGKEGGL